MRLGRLSLASTLFLLVQSVGVWAVENRSDGKEAPPAKATSVSASDLAESREAPRTENAETDRPGQAETPAEDVQLSRIGSYRVLSGESEITKKEDPLELFNPFLARKPRPFHGTFYAYHRNDFFDARNFFDAVDKPLPEFKRNQFGVILGAELPRGLDVIGTYEGLRIVKGSTLVSHLPTEAMKEGDFSALDQVLLDPLTGEPLLGNQIAADRIHPVSSRLLSLLPDPNSGDSDRNYVNNQPEITDADSMSLRVEYDLCEGSQVYTRYELVEDSGFQASSLPAFGLFGKTRAQEARAWLNQRFSSETSAEFYVGFQRRARGTFSQNSGQSGLLESLGISGVAVSDPVDEGFPEFQMSGYASLGEDPGSPRASVQNWYWTGTGFNRIMGEHSIRFGGSLQARQVNNDRTGGIRRGSFYFGGSFTGDAFADFLLGIPETAKRGIGVSRSDIRGSRWETYVSDEWRIRPDFRWSAGIRYNFFSPYTSVSDAVSTFFPLLFEPPDDGEIVVAGSEQAAELGFTGLAGRSLIHPDRNDWSPQMSISYNPLGGNQLVLRASYSMYYTPPESHQFIGWMTRNSPFYEFETSESSASPDLDLSNPFETPVPVEQTMRGIEPKLQSANVQYWRLMVDTRLSEKWNIRTSYAGSRGTGMRRVLVSNVPLPGSGILQERRPNPDFGSFSTLSGGGAFSEHTFEWDLERQLADGFSLESVFRWSRQLDDLFWDDPANPRDLQSERAAAGWIPNKRFDLRYILDLPLDNLASTGWLDETLSGWRVSGITRIQDGPYFSVSMPGDPNNDGVYGDRPDRVGSGGISSPGIDKWFETGDFVAPAEYAFGDSGRNILRGPSYHNWDLSLSKRTGLADGHFLEFRFQMFNAFNHPNFDRPASVLGNSSFGKIFGASRAREIEVALKYSF